MKSKRLLHGLCALIAVSALWAAAAAASREGAQPLAPGMHRFVFAPDNSTITFFLKGNVHDTLGTVTKMAGTARGTITPEGTLVQPEVQISFRTEDMYSDDARRDKRMKEKFLETRKYPGISFVSAGTEDLPGKMLPLRQATREAPFQFMLTGKLTIHGQTKDIPLPLAVYPHSGRIVCEGKTTLLLQDYHIKNPSLLIFRTSNEVEITFHIELGEMLQGP